MSHVGRARGRLFPGVGSSAGGGGVDFTAYQQRPGDFARLLGIRLWSHQERAALSVRDHARTSWRSCNGAGKTLTAAFIALWRLLCWTRSLVFIIGPNARLVRAVAWREIERITRSAEVLRGLEPIGAVPELGWSPLPGRFLLGLTSDQPEGAAGLHDEVVTAVQEEASGISGEMHQAMLGSCTGANARLLLVGNPLHRSGHFYDSFTRKAQLYNVLHTGADDVIREAGNIPGLIDQRFVDEMILDYGEGSAAVRTRCYGEPPDSGDDSVIPFDLVEAARARWSKEIATGAGFEKQGRLELGVDPSYFGDDKAVVFPRRGLVAAEPIVYQRVDGVQLAARVLEAADRLRLRDEVPIVRVDVIGIGASVFDQLKQHSHEIDLVAVNVGESATVETYERQRDQIWFAARDWLKAGGALPPDEKLAGELIAPTFGYSPRGRQKVESKADVKARLRRSPDRADAFCLSVFTATAQKTNAELHREIYAAGRSYADPWLDLIPGRVLRRF